MPGVAWKPLCSGYSASDPWVQVPGSAVRCPCMVERPQQAWLLGRRRRRKRKTREPGLRSGLTSQGSAGRCWEGKDTHGELAWGPSSSSRWMGRRSLSPPSSTLTQVLGLLSERTRLLMDLPATGTAGHVLGSANCLSILGPGNLLSFSF